MNFVEILKSLQIFEVMDKNKNINYKIYLKTSSFFIVCINHNEEHYVNENH